MAHQINERFLKEFEGGSLKELLKYIQLDNTLNLELRGDRVTVYYRGGALLTVLQDTYKFLSLDKKYHKGQSFMKANLCNINEYIPKAKHIIDLYISEVRNHLGEKDVQQQIAKENNNSPNSLDTDYFIIDTEYQDLGRFDIIALRWDSIGSIRKLTKSFLPTITIFEVKQGFKSVPGNSGMQSHIKNFEMFLKTKDMDSFKKDMINVFSQKRKLGLIKGMDKYKEVTVVNPNIEFVFILANYKQKSKQLKKELEKIDNCQFIYANSTGYGLFARNVIDKSKFCELFL